MKKRRFPSLPSFLCKNNDVMSMWVLALLVAICSQSFAFFYFTETWAGRLFLIASLVFLAQCHYMFLFAGLFLFALAFKYHRGTTWIWEGFEDGVKKDPKPKSSEKEDEESKPEDALAVEAKEGFCMTDRETTMMRGKSSKAMHYTRPHHPHLSVAPDDGWLSHQQFAPAK